MIKVPSNDPIKREYAFLARRYDTLWDSYIQQSLKETLDHGEFKEGSRLLDIGCGTGQLIEVVGQAHPSISSTGLDLTFEMVEIAHDRLGKRIPLCCGDATKLPFADKTFDILVSTSVFHYIGDPRTALAEVMRVLRPGGILVLTDWCGDFFGYRLLDRLFGLLDPAHFHIYSNDEIRTLLREAGFESFISDAYRAGWFWRLMTISARKAL